MFITSYLNKDSISEPEGPSSKEIKLEQTSIACPCPYVLQMALTAGRAAKGQRSETSYQKLMAYDLLIIKFKISMLTPTAVVQMYNH